MDNKFQSFLPVILGIVVLAIALKLGVIGGGGSGARRDENPYLFWFIFGIIAVFTLLATILALAGSR